MASVILNVKPLGSGPMPTIDPFLFCVYHKDEYPPGNTDMEAPFVGNGSDFNPTAPYRMYHGMKIPGFPQHPHRGFETITATIDGIIDHADSTGNAGRYGLGDVQHMTAGKGVVHSEMFPLLKQDDYNPTRFFQIWLNLPAAKKMVDPSFAMFWANEVPKWVSDDKKATVTLWYGTNYFGIVNNNPPPPNSWSSDPNNDVAVMHITIQPGGKITLPAANIGTNVNRSLFYIEGNDNEMKIDGTVINSHVVVQIQPDKDIVLEMNNEAKNNGEFLLLQGKPINEPVKQYGPFVMNTEQEIEQAFRDYQITKFGGWPWERDDMVFPREKGRFAKLDGKESSPPDSSCIA